MGENVLVPVDRSSQSEKAFEYVLEKVPDPSITLLHVISQPSAFTHAGETDFDLEGYQQEEQQRREQAEQFLEEYRKTASERGIEAEMVLRVGKPANRILETVESHDIDHIVMGSHGRSGAGRVVFGSVAETVTRRSTVPVTIVR